MSYHLQHEPEKHSVFYFYISDGTYGQLELAMHEGMATIKMHEYWDMNTILRLINQTGHYLHTNRLTPWGQVDAYMLQ